IIATLKKERATDAARARGEQLLEKLTAGAALKELADAEKLAYQEADAAGRDASELNPEVLRSVFRMPRPDADKALDKGFALINGDYAIVRLSAVSDADPSTMSS